MSELINAAKELLEDESTEIIVKVNSMMEAGEMNRAYNYLNNFNTANLISSAYDLFAMVDRLIKQSESLQKSNDELLEALKGIRDYVLDSRKHNKHLVKSVLLEFTERAIAKEGE